MMRILLLLILFVNNNVIGVHSFQIPTTTTTTTTTTKSTFYRNSIIGPAAVPVVVQPTRGRTSCRVFRNDDVRIDQVYHTNKRSWVQKITGRSIFRTTTTTGSTGSNSQGIVELYSDTSRVLNSLVLLSLSSSAINESESDGNSNRTPSRNNQDTIDKLLTVRKASMVFITTYYKVVCKWITKYFTVLRTVYIDFVRNEQSTILRMTSLLRTLFLNTVTSIVKQIQTGAIFIQSTIVTYTSTIIIVLMSTFLKLQEQIINNTRKATKVATMTKIPFSNGVDIVHDHIHMHTVTTESSSVISKETNIELTSIPSSITEDRVTIPSLSLTTIHDSIIIDTTPTPVSTLSSSRISNYNMQDDNNNNNNNDVISDQGSVTLAETAKSRLGNFFKKNTSFLYDYSNGSTGTEVRNDSNTEKMSEVTTTISKSFKQTATSFLSFGSSNSNNSVDKKRLLSYRNQQPKAIQEEILLQAKYAAIPTVEERAFQILVDLGMVEIHHHSNDSSNDNSFSGKVVPLVLDNTTGEWE